MDISLQESQSRMLDRLSFTKRVVLMTLVVVGPLLVAPGVTFDEYNLPKIALLVAGVGMAAALRLAELAFGSTQERLGSLAIPAACLSFPLAISWLFSPFKEWAVLGEYNRFQGVIPYLLFALFGVLLAEAFAGKAPTLAWAVAGSAGVAGFYAFIQYLGIDPLPWSTTRPVGSYPTTTIGNTNFAGAFFAIVMPVALALWWEGKRRVPAIILTVVIVEGWIFSVSQGAWVAGVTGVVVTAALIVRQRWSRANALVAVAALGAAALVVALPLASTTARVPLVGETVKLRGLLWKQATQLWLESPVVGNGPNAFAIEGIRYRSPEDGLLKGDSLHDDPHSVFFSLLSAAGLLGAAGYVAIGVWTADRTARLRQTDVIGAGFAGSVIAYLVQSLVSIDEPALRSALWVALAGLAISAAPISNVSSRSARPATVPGRTYFWRAVALPLGAALASGSVLWSAILVSADRDIAIGRKLLEAGQIDQGIARFEQGLARRRDPFYQALFGTVLAEAASRRQGDIGALIARIDQQFAYLKSFPDIYGSIQHARALADLSWFEPDLREDALKAYRDAATLDVHNPVLRAEMAEILVASREYEAAERELAPFANEDTRFPRVLTASAVLAAKTDRPDDAMAALHLATQLAARSCPVLVAREVVLGEKLGTAEVATRIINLRLACDPASYQMMLELVPTSRRDVYLVDNTVEI